jgi:hypothetical protein
MVWKKNCRSGEQNADFIPPPSYTWCDCCQLNPKHCFKWAATNIKRFALVWKKSCWSGEHNKDFLPPPCCTWCDCCQLNPDPKHCLKDFNERLQTETFCYGLQETLLIRRAQGRFHTTPPCYTWCHCCQLNPDPKHCFKGFQRAATNTKSFAMVCKKSCWSGELNADS